MTLSTVLKQSRPFDDGANEIETSLRRRTFLPKKSDFLMTDILLDSDGTLGINLGVLVLIEAPTGIVYHQQCGGLATLDKKQEGFIIPVGGPDIARPIFEWFESVFKGHCYQGRSDWTEDRVMQLRALIEALPIWYQNKEESHRTFLQLDEGRMDECCEAWIPVRTPYGPGIVLLANSD